MFLKLLFRPLSQQRRIKLLTKPLWLFCLVQLEDLETLRLLLHYLDAGYKKELMLSDNGDRQSVLMVAVGVHSKQEMFLMLSQQLTALDWIEVLQVRDRDKRTVLHYAALYGRIDILKLLIDTSNGSSEVIGVTDRAGATFLDYCLTSLPKEKFLKLTSYIEPDPNLWALIKNNARIHGNDMNIIHTLLEMHNHSEIRLLFQKFSPLRRISLIIHQNKGCSALTAACISSCQECNAIGNEWRSLIIEQVTGIKDYSGENLCLCHSHAGIICRFDRLDRFSL